jgi:hypothetical protein
MAHKPQTPADYLRGRRAEAAAAALRKMEADVRATDVMVALSRRAADPVEPCDAVPAHPDHGLPHCPRRPDGSLDTYYLCSFEEIGRFDLGRPPPLGAQPGRWTVERQEKFIRILAATASVTDACDACDMTRMAAYRLRWSDEGVAFRLGWDAALATAHRVLQDTAFDRAVNGVEVPVWHRGELVGHRRVFNDRLLMFLLREHRPHPLTPALGEGTKTPSASGEGARQNPSQKLLDISNTPAPPCANGDATTH